MDWRPKATIPTFLGVLYFLLDLPGRWGVLVNVISFVPPIFHQAVFPIAALMLIGIGFIAITRQPKKVVAPIELLDQHQRPFIHHPAKNRSVLLICSAVGAAVVVAGIMVTAVRLFPLHSGPSSEQPIGEGQFGIVKMSPDLTAKWNKATNDLLRSKAELLDTKTYHELIVARSNLRKEVEHDEEKYHCLLDINKGVCLPKPPTNIAAGVKVDINVSFAVVADEASPLAFWMIHARQSKLRVPIVLFVTLRNISKDPVRINLLYLEARNAGGWADVRMADTLSNDQVSLMKDKPLVFLAKNGAVSLKGEYLIPSLYDRVIQPGDKVEGWVISEWPKGFKYGSSIGDMRVSFVSSNYWIGSKTFSANPPVYGDHLKDIKGNDFYLFPLDVLFTED